MEMKKIAFAAVVVAATSMSVAVATTISEAPAPTPVPTSGAIVSLPAMGSLVGATIISKGADWWFPGDCRCVRGRTRTSAAASGRSAGSGPVGGAHEDAMENIPGGWKMAVR
ncbi:hypothetical protein Salat_2662000 [Sesamum alatum]|uniref:Uncharacterized protein n=1 Tax=Sesamum alatum TaxID=300844 RepID=A0AAE1XQ95_9LAMI|nr:hypothetical protein Salat_2662000 [Sesamum alatum]